MEKNAFIATFTFYIFMMRPNHIWNNLHPRINYWTHFLFLLQTYRKLQINHYKPLMNLATNPVICPQKWEMQINYTECCSETQGVPCEPCTSESLHLIGYSVMDLCRSIMWWFGVATHIGALHHP